MLFLHRFRHDLVDILSNDGLLRISKDPGNIFSNISNNPHIISLYFRLEHHTIFLKHDRVNVKFLIFKDFHLLVIVVEVIF
jgi:hypothetical protein